MPWSRAGPGRVRKLGSGVTRLNGRIPAALAARNVIDEIPGATERLYPAAA